MLDLSQRKTIILITVGLLLFGVVGVFAYLYFAPKESKAPAKSQTILGRFLGTQEGVTETSQEETRTTSELKPGDTLETPSEETLVRITDFPVVSPTLTSSGDGLLFYKKDGGDLYRSDFEGKTQEKLSNITVVGLIEAVWSPKGDRALVFYLDRETKKAFLHIGTSSVAVLPQDIQSVMWLPDGSSFVYTIRRNGQTDIVSADATGKNSRTLATTPLRDLQIAWAGRDAVMLQTPSSGLAEGFIFRLDRRTGTLTKFLGPQFGLTSLWSPDGSRVLLTTTDRNGKNLSLEIVDSRGLGVFSPTIATLPEKCTWTDNKTVICAVPQYLPDTAVWPDYYLKGEVITVDRFVRINTDIKQTDDLNLNTLFDSNPLLTTPNANTFFLIDRTDGTLWAVKLQ